MMQLREMPGFGLVVDGLSWAISAFDNKDLAFAIALGILVVAFGIFIFFHIFRHRRWVKPIRQLVNALKKLQDTDSDAETRLIQADRLFEGKNHLSKLWREYRNHLIDNQKAPGYINLIDPRTWFSLESLPGRGYEHWCSTWAGVFLTIGLLFTFIGLSAALIKVGGIDGADSSAMKAAITGILGVSSAKFITSIAGLLAYIFFSLITRRYQASQQAASHALADAIQHFSVPLTPEILLYQQNETASRQLTRMERLTDDLAIAIDGKLEQRLQILSRDFGMHLGSIQQDLPEKTSTPIVQAIDSMSQSVAAEFSKQVQQTAGGGIDTVITRFEGIASKLEELKGGLGNAGESFGKDIGEAAKILREAADNMGKGLDSRTDGLSSTIGEFGGKLDSILASLGQVPENIDKALKQTLDKLTLAIGELVKQLNEGGKSGASALTEGGQEAGNRLLSSAQEAGQQLQSRLDDVSTKLDGIAGALGQVPTNISDALNVTLNRLTEAVEALMTRLAQGGQDSADALRAGGQQAGENLENAVDRAGSEFDRQVAEATEKLVTQFGVAQASLQTAINDLASRLNSVETSLNALSGAVAAQVQNLNAAGQTFKTAGQTVTLASGALQQAAQPLVQTGALITTGLGELNQGVQKAADIHLRTTQFSQSVLDSLKSTAEAAERTFKTHEDRFGRADVDLANALDALRAGVQQVAQETQAVFAEYDKHITTAVSNLGAVASELLEAAEEMAAARQAQPQTIRRYP